MHVKRKTLIGLTGAILLAFNACGTNASIRKFDETKISGEITRSDKDFVYVKKFNRETKVPRTEIADISHPGKALMWVGSGVFLAGAGTVILGAVVDGKQVTAYSYGPTGSSSSTSTASGTGFYIAGGITAGLGLLFFWTGYSNYSTSKDNLEPGTLAFLSPGAGMFLGYETVIRPAATLYGNGEPVHQLKMSWRF